VPFGNFNLSCIPLLQAGNFALVEPDEKHQYRNTGNTPFKMICGVPKEFE